MASFFQNIGTALKKQFNSLYDIRLGARGATAPVATPLGSVVKAIPVQYVTQKVTASNREMTIKFFTLFVVFLFFLWGWYFIDKNHKAFTLEGGFILTFLGAFVLLFLTNQAYNVDVVYKINSFIAMAIIYVILTALFYSYDPFGYVTKYLGIFIFTSILVFSVICISISWFIYKRKNNLLVIDPMAQIVIQMLILMVGGVAIGLGVYYLLNASGAFSTNFSLVSVLIYIIVGMIIAYSAYKLLMFANAFSKDKKIFSNLYDKPWYSIFFGTGSMAQQFYKSRTSLDRGERYGFYVMFFVMLLVTLYLIFSYITRVTVGNFSKQGGKQFVVEPIDVDSEQTIASFHDLNTENKFKYRYGLSFWVYIDEHAPNTNYSYSSYTTILDYGGKPNVSYNPSLNTLIVTVKSVDPETQISTEKIIMKKENISLQKWHNIVINYSGGTMDIFYDGELANSSINVVPYMTMDKLTVGQKGGINGKLCNLLYFNQTMNIFQIQNIYSVLKSKTPPTMSPSELLYFIPISI